jgi:hypothetical protein
MGCVLPKAWNHFLAQWENNETQKRLAKFKADTFSEEATGRVQGIIEDEPAADKKQLNELVSKIAAKKTKQLEKQLEKLTQQVASINQPAKNGQESRKPPGSDTKQKRAPGKRNGQANGKQQGSPISNKKKKQGDKGKAGASNKGTGSASKRNTTKRKPSSLNGGGPRNQRPNDNSSRRSTTRSS